MLDYEVSRCAEALERIADALDLLTRPQPESACAHPEDQRELMATSTLTTLQYRCKACGAEGIP